MHLECQAFCNPSPDMAKKVEEFQHLLAPWTLESLDSFVGPKIRVIDTVATSTSCRGPADEHVVLLRIAASISR